MFDIPTPEFSPYVSETALVQHETYPRQPVYTELAKSFIPLESTTTLASLFPDETILERTVVIDRIFETISTIFPVVKWGMPDLFVNDEGKSTLRKYYEPIPIRMSKAWAYAQLNNQVREGTVNERANPQEILANEIRKVMKAHNLTWDVYRAMMLALGGIQYTDPRTGVPVNVSSMIPGHNLINYNMTQGWNGRNEANLFRSLVDANTPEPSQMGIPFTNPDISIVSLFRKLARWHKNTNKTKLTKCYCDPDMKEVILMSNEMKLAQGGVIPKFGAVTGDKTSNNSIVVHPGSNPVLTNAVGLDSEGDIISIAGIQIETIDTMYKDPVDGVEKRIFPKNKLVFVAETDTEGKYEAPGRTQYCISENSDSQPGLWTRTEEETTIPAAPGIAMQFGNAGLPYLKYPDRVLHVKVAETRDIKNLMGITDDAGFGYF